MHSDWLVGSHDLVAIATAAVSVATAAVSVATAVVSVVTAVSLMRGLYRSRFMLGFVSSVYF